MSKSNGKATKHRKVETAKRPKQDREEGCYQIALGIARAAWRVIAISEVDLDAVVIGRDDMPYVERLWAVLREEFPQVEIEYLVDQRCEQQTVILFRDNGAAESRGCERIREVVGSAHHPTE